MLLLIFVVSVGAALAVGGYTFGILFGNWSKGAKPFVPPPAPVKPVYQPFIPPMGSGPVAVVEQPAVPSVFVSMPMPEHVFPPPPSPIATGSMLAKTVSAMPPAPTRTAKGSIPPPLPPRARRSVRDEEFLAEETNVDFAPASRR